jgi:hypothetical protein
VEAYLFTNDSVLLEACLRTADGILGAMEPDGRLPGRLNDNWKAAVPWVCLTGTSQIAECLFLLYGATKKEIYKKYALAANSFVRRSLKTEGPVETRGGVKGSFPVDGDYGKWQYLNWACKFMIDANRAELEIRD